MSDADRDREALRAVLTWAEQRCPCHEETSNPCPLCGASVENLEACKSAENTMPPDLLAKVRLALSNVTHARAQAGEPVAWIGPYKDAATALNELRKSVAEIIGADPEMWPDHGNAPLAIAATLALARRTHPAPAQEPLAVPTRMTADEAWQDLCEKDDRTSIDYPGFALIRQDELAGYMAAAPVSPPRRQGRANDGAPYEI